MKTTVFEMDPQAGFRTEVRAVNTPLWREIFAGFDWLSLRCSQVYRGAGVERGDGSPVIVVPGCFASDASLRELHSWLGRIGYRAYNSGIGRNARCPELSVEMLIETVDRAFEETGKKVTLIGHSLGGLLARGAAILRPQRVAQVITLGSPVNGIAAHPTVLAAAQSASGDCRGDCLDALQTPLPQPVAATCVYSKGDGVVDWRTCQRDDATNVEVSGTHTGLIFNPQVYEVLAAALSRQEASTAEVVDYHAEAAPVAPLARAA